MQLEMKPAINELNDTGNTLSDDIVQNIVVKLQLLNKWNLLKLEESSFLATSLAKLTIEAWMSILFQGFSLWSGTALWWDRERHPECPIRVLWAHSLQKPWRTPVSLKYLCETHHLRPSVFGGIINDSSLRTKFFSSYVRENIFCNVFRDVTNSSLQCNYSEGYKLSDSVLLMLSRNLFNEFG